MTTAFYPSQKFRFLKSLICVTLVTFFYAFSAKAQLLNLPVTGFNADVVGDGAGVGTSSTTQDVDGAGWIFVNSTFNPGAGICAAGATALPATNLISSLTTAGLTYSLQPYNANNSLRLTSGSSGTLTLVTPTQAANIYLLALGGSGACTITATVNFSDGSTQVISGSAADWCSGVGAATTVFYRISRTATTCTGGTCQYLYDVNLAISAANLTKTITSISIASTGGILNVMGAGMKAVCATPIAQATSPLFTPSTGSVAASFTAASGAPSGYLVVRYPAGSLSTNPVNGTTYTPGQSLGLGTVVQSAAATSFNAVGLTGSTTYDFYVYSYNSGATCGGPVYLTTGGFLGSQTTNACGSVIAGTIPVGAGLPNDPINGYSSLTNAIAAIGVGGLNGATILELQPSYTSAYATANETFPITFPSNPCISAVNSLVIRPAAGVASIINLTSAVTSSTINFNGATNITIDGRPGGTGSTSMLSIANTNLGASPAILFNNDASNDVVRYCTIQSVNNSTTSGTIVFGTSTGVTGNDNNTIDNCTIIDGATTPVYGIYSSGSSAAIDNSGNSITNCNIANYFAPASISGGIVLTATGNSAWTISNNKFYQTATRVYTSSQALLSAITVSGGSGYTISGNTIGYANASGTGTTNMIGNTVTLAGFPTSYATTGTANATRYIGINCAFTAGGTVSNIQGNTIGGLALYTSSGATTTYGILCGIQVTSGNANIGTVTGNTIGSTTGIGSLYAATTTTGGFVVGIYATSANTVTIQNNTIGAIDASGTTASINGGITGIDVAGAGTFTISNNTIGHSVAGNLRTGFIQNGATLGAGGATMTSTTGATGAMIGIRSAVTGAVLNINSNTIQGYRTSGTVSAFTGITSTGNVTSSVAINNNFLGTASAGLVNYTVANSGALLGINCTGATSATLHSIQNNDIRGITNSVAGTQAQTYLTLTGATAANDVATIGSNTFTNLNVNTTGAIIFINQGYTIATTGQLIINNNAIVTGFNRASAGAVTITTTNSTSGTGSIQNITNNNFSNITVTGASALLGFNNTDGGTGTTKQITGNTFNNWSGTTSTINCMNFTYLNGVSNISNNTITNIAGQSSIVGMTIGATANNANPLNVANNTISNLVSSGTGGAVTGISCTNTSAVININNNTINTFSSTGASAVTGISIGGATNTTVFKNKIYDLSGSNASSTVNGILVSAGTLINVNNNLIGDLRTTAANAANPLVGLNFTGGTTINASYNTVRLAGTSSGALFGSSALSASTTPNLTLRNNILINNSGFSGAGLAVAYRRSTTTLTTYNALSNNNIFYAGTPSANNLIYADGTNSDQNVVAYKARVAPVDALSGAENVAFLSTTGSSANFLHVDGAIASISESGAVNIAGITDDYDNQIRFGNVGYAGTGTAPDAGADEYNGISVGALAAPINFASNTSTTTSFNITWDDNSVGEATFVIARSLNPGGPFAVVAYVTSTSSASTGTSYSLAQTGLLGNTTYYYQITASNVTTSAALTGNASTLPCGSGLTGTYLIPGAYPSITAAITDLQTLGMAAPVTLELDPTYTGAGESYPLVFGNAIGCLGATNTLTVRPSSAVVSPLSINSASAVATIDMNGGNFVTFDGRPGGIGSASMLNIINTSAAGVAIRITNDASNNTITYCDVQGQNTVAVPTLTTAAGVIFINSANATNLQGNDNNTISYCNIHGTGAVTANFPAMGIASFGTVTTTNSYNDNCTVSNCNIYDYFHATAASTGIKLDAGNTAWTLNNNRFYQTAALNITTSTATHRAIWVTPNTASISNAANGFVITNNTIGGNNASGTGNYVMAGTGAYSFMGMDLSLGLGTATSIQNNIMTNMNLTGGFSGNAVYGINVVRGNANVGTIAGNLIGSTSTNGAITVTTTLSGGSMIGLRSAGPDGAINFSNNIVSGIDMVGDAATIATGFNGIACSGGTTITVNNNTIGSASLANSINMVSTSATSTTAAAVRGIICNSSSVPTTSTITNNLVANINSNYSASGAQATTLAGIVVTTGASTVSGNTIRNLTSFTQTTSGGSTAGVIGISYTSPTAPAVISGNIIHTLKSTNATTTSGPVVAGLFYGGASGTTNLIAKNSIHSLSIVSNTVNTSAAITGMDIATGQLTIQNNMIRLGYDENGNSVTCPTLVRGITKNTAIANVYNNSIYIGGNNVLSTPAANTFAFIRTAAAATDDIRNNIFVNNRSNATTGGKHYQINLTSTATLNLNFNDYNGSGIGSVFGFNGTADVTGYTLGWVTGDLNSQTGDPQFINPTGSAATGDLHINPSVQTVIEQNGINIATVSDDFDSQIRASFSPEDIGADAGNFTPINPCTGTPPASVATLTNTSVMCVSGSKIVYLAGGFVSQPGYTYQWQESATGLPGSFVNVTTGSGGTTNTYSTPVLTSSMYYQCIVSCINGGVSTTSSSVQAQVNPLPTITVTPATGTAVCSGSNVDLVASGAATYVWSANPGVAGYPQVSLFSTPNNTAKVTSRPSSTLTATPNVTNPPFPTVATPNWTYTVTGTDAAGCVSTTTVVLNVTTAASIPLTLTTSYTPDPICTPGTPITFTANNTGNIGSGSWVYNWFDSLGTTLLQTTTNTATSNSFTPTAPTSNGNKVYTVRVSNTVCPSSYAIASPAAFVGFTSLIVPTNPNCGDNGIISVYPEGQTDFSDWYVNNFTTGLLGAAFDAGYGNVNFTGGICNLTPLTATGQNGALLIRNPGSINTNNLQVDFKLTTAPLGFNFNILGADGMAWSYAPDVVQGTITPAAGGFNAECGSGSGFKLAFDATANGAQNTPGCYLMYNCTTPDQGPGSPGVIAFKQGSFWQGLVGAPVRILISENGYVTVSLNNQVIFDHVPLPQAYLTSNKSTWIHSFTARTGGSTELHSLDDLSIRYNAYEYSINSTNGSDGSWQTENIFPSLAAGSYPVWVRKLNDPSCYTNTGTAVLNVAPSPSSANTVPASGYSSVVCYGSGTTLTTSVFVPGAIFYWEQAASLAGPWTAAVGTNSNASYITPGLISNTYYRLTFTCPSSTPITSTPLLVTVNAGTIASTNSPQLVNCLGDNVTLTATPGSNTTCVWYASATGGSPLANGNSYTVAPTTLPTTYYVEPVTTVYSNKYFNGGQTVISNSPGSPASGVNISTRFTTTASIIIDSIKVLPGATGTLQVALQNAGSAVNISTFNFNVTAAMVGNFVNVPVNFTVLGSGNYQLTTTGVACSYYSPYTSSYSASYMSLGGVFTITGGSTTPTGAASTAVYGTAFRWAISSSCPAGSGARIPVVAQANPATAVNVTVSAASTCAGTIQSLTASSLATYSNYTWTPVTDLYIDAAATIAYTAGNNSTVVYMKSATSGNKTYTVSTAGSLSGCTNTASGTINVIAAPTVLVSASPAAVCLGSNAQLSVSTSGAYCIPTYSTGTSAGDYCTLVSIGTTTLNNATGASATPYYNLYPASGNTTATLTAGNTYTLTLVAGTFSSNDFAAWIDYNQNGDLATAGEKLGEVDNIGASPVSTTIVFTVPVSANNGLTRFRVREADQASIGGMDPCVAYTFGETEDYMVNIIGGVTPAGFSYNWSANPTYLSATNIGNPVAQAVVTPQTYTVVVTDAATGCTNTGTTAVTVKLPTTSNNTAAGCNLFIWNGTTYTASGVYTFTTVNAAGCDSMATLNLTILNSSASTTPVTTCGSYVWNGNTYTATGTYTYTSTNAAGCDSVQTLNLTIACNSVLNLTCFIEGYWDGTSAMVPVLSNQGETSSATACDSIDVELHAATSPYALVQSVRTLLNQNGTASCVFGPVSGSYYVVVKNRSMVAAWSAVPVAISNTPASYNFTTAEAQAYGAGGFPTAMKEVTPGVWAFYSGDIVVDENVDLLDLGLLETDISDFAFGYRYLPANINYPGIIATDLNGDGNVDLLDSPIMEDNISNFIFANHP